MPTVLIPTDDTMIIPGITAGYAHHGWDVVVGTENFFNKALHADLVHYQWPEEFSDWKLPSPKTMGRIRDTIDWWSQRCPGAVSVHNLYPHGYEGNPTFKQLYELFYERCNVIMHFSQTSQQLVLEEFPSARQRRNIVTTCFNYDRLLPAKLDRDGCRRTLGFAPEDFVVLVFGALRFWREVELVRRAYKQAKVPHKRLLMAGRYTEQVGRMKGRLRRAQLKLWCASTAAVVPPGYIEDEDAHKYLEACDVILVPRIKDMTSGLIGLGLTFGRTMVAPSHGSYPEYLQGTDNPFYDPGDAASMARAIERAAAADRDLIGRQNRERADRWNWNEIVAATIDAAGLPGISTLR